jgi:hypothetical protein
MEITGKYLGVFINRSVLDNAVRMVGNLPVITQPASEEKNL